jgi:uncharacterized protein YabN with tetrapyrrole methylase and pyrophosphatase domain
MSGEGSLLVVGTGIMLGAHVTAEAKGAITEAELVMYVVPGVCEEWLNSLNPRMESLHDCYAAGKPREQSYDEMVDRIVTAVCSGRRVCAVFYGHPGVFVNPSHRAIAAVRAKGLPARMMPGVSAEDCLFADLGIDPGGQGCISYEATDFLIRRRVFDPATLLILWQIGALGEASVAEMRDTARLAVLVDRLREEYADDHEVIVYEAASFAICDPYIKRLPLASLVESPAPAMSTLVVPPAKTADVDDEWVRRLTR